MKKKEMIISLHLKGKKPKQIEEESGASSKYVKRVIKEYTAKVVEASYEEIENVPPFIKELKETCDKVQEGNLIVPSTGLTYTVDKSNFFRFTPPIKQVNLSGYKESFQGTIISGQYNVIGDINLENDRILLVKCPLNGGIYGVKVEDVC